MRSRFPLSFRIAPAEIGTLPRGQVAGPSSGQFPRATLDKRGNIRLYMYILSLFRTVCKNSIFCQRQLKTDPFVAIEN